MITTANSEKTEPLLVNIGDNPAFRNPFGLALIIKGDRDPLGS